MEHRRQKRVAKNLLAKVKAPAAEFFAYVQDLAKNGIGMCCNRLLGIGTQLGVDLNIPGHATLTVQGKVLWKRDLPSISKNKYQYGVGLLEPPDQYVGWVETLIKQAFERRQHPRFTDVLTVESGDVLDLLDAATTDVSAGGLYIRTGRPLEVGTQYEMSLSSAQLPEPIQCLGEVVAVFETDLDDLDHPYGAGVRFISFVGEDGARFKDYLKSLEDLYRFHWPPELSALIAAPQAATPLAAPKKKAPATPAPAKKKAAPQPAAAGQAGASRKASKKPAAETDIEFE